MLEEFRIKLYRTVMGKPAKKAFVNPYLKPEVVYNPRGIGVVKAKRSLSFPILKECVDVMRDDVSVLKTPAGKVGDMIREHNVKQDEQELFDALARKGM